MKLAVSLCMLWTQLAFAGPSSGMQSDASPLSAHPPTDADFCRSGLFPREQKDLSLGVIRGAKSEKVHFFEDMGGCPANRATCMRAAYLVPGDEIVVGKSNDGWACVWFQKRKQASVSWVPKKNVALLPSSTMQPIRDWIGTWVYGPDRIRIARLTGSDKLQIESSLRWDGGTLANGEAIAHFGGVQAPLDIDGPRAHAVESGCEVQLTRIGRYLVVDDNGACGGVNVRHTGLYVRGPK